MSDPIDPGQIDLQSALNDVLRQRTEIIESQNSAMSGQGNLASSLNDLLGGVQESASNASGGMGNLSDALGGLVDQSGEGESNMAGFMESLMDRKAASVGLGVGLAKIGFDGVIAKAKAVKAAISGMLGPFSMITNLIGGIAKAASAGFGFLSKAASEAHGNGLEVTKAWETVKKTISTVGPGFDNVKTAVSNLGMEGASMTAMFGRGPGGMAAAIAYAGDLATGLGETFTMVGQDFAKNVDTFVLANKGLGISADGMKNMYLQAAHSGQELSDVLADQAKMSVHLSESFGVDAKHIGKNLDSMAQDFATFGGLSQKELAATAAYAAKLGVGMKALQGIVGKTDDFEGAATAASELASTFGMNIDAMDLMTADPAEKLQMMRDAFQETGKSFADMSRQEKQRMADLTGMDVADLAGALNPENAEVDFSSMEDAAAAAQNGAITQEEANVKLAKSLDKVVEAMQGVGKESFFGAFTDGLTKGIMNSPEMLGILKDLSKAMNVVFKAGKQVGRMFAKELGPGGALQFVGDFLRTAFDPKVMQKRMDGVIGSFKEFFAALKDPDKSVDAFGNLITNLMDNIFGGAEGVTSGGIKIKNFFIKMFDFAFGLMIGAIPGILIGGVNFIINLLDGFTAKMAGEENKTADGVSKTMYPMIQGAFTKLASSLGKIDFKGLLSSIGKFLMTAVKEYPNVFIGIAAYMFGGPLIAAGFAAAKAGAVTAIAKGMKGLLSAGAKAAKNPRAIADVGARVAPNLSAGIAKGAAVFSRLAGPVAIVAAVAGLGNSINKLQEVHGKRMTEQYGKANMQAGIFAGGLIDTITFGLLPDSVITAIADLFAKMTNAIGRGLEAIGLGALADLFAETFDFIIDYISGFSDIIYGIFTGDGDRVTKGFVSMWGGALEFIKNIPGKVLSLLSGVIKSVASITQKVAIWIFTDGLKMLINAVTNVVKAIGGALWNGITAVVDMVFNPVDTFKKAFDWGKGLVSGMWDAIKGLPGYLLGLMVDMWVAIAEYWGFASPATKMIELGVGLLQGLLNGLGAIATKVAELFSAAWGAITSIFSFDIFYNLGSRIWEGLKGGLGKIGEKFKGLFGAAWGLVKRIFSGSPIDSPRGAGGKLGSGISRGLGKGLKNIGPQMQQAALDGLSALGETMMKGAAVVGENFVAAFGNLAQGIFQQLGILGGMVQEFFSQWLDASIRSITSVVEVFSFGFNTMISLLQNGAQAIFGIFQGISEVLFGFFSGIVEVAASNMNAVINTIVNGFKGVFEVFSMARDFVLETFSGIGQTLVSIFSSAITAVVSVVTNGIRGMVNVLGGALRLVGNIISVTAGLGSLGSLVSAIGSGLSFFGPDPKDAQKQLKSFEYTFNAMHRTQVALKRLEKSLSGSKAQTEHMAERIASVVDAYNESNAMLSDIRPVNIDAVLQQVNESLKVKRDNLTIKQENVNIHINMRVTMEAGDVLKAIEQTPRGKQIEFKTQ